ncbi:MAG: hypothetical protein HY824_00800 [Acidobacteria bacterium]|nr:hypothetical protein [Acidobacteriota bacterium]
MRRRLLVSLGGAVAVAGVLSVTAVAQAQRQSPPAGAGRTAPAPATSGRAAPAAKPAAGRTSTAPRTPWGDPDLQGIWNFATSTPLERPAALGEKAVLSGNEAEQFEETLAYGLTRDRRDGGNEADVARAYNEHWMDPNRLKLLSDKRTSLVMDPPDGRIPPRVPPTPERQKRAQEVAARAARFNAGLPLSAQDFQPPVRGIIRTDMPPYLGTIYNNTAQIFQSPGYVVIELEMIHSARIIPMDGRPHLASGLKQWLGDTRGRWDGSTLVLETTNFRNDIGALYGGANADTFKITERFTRVDPDTLTYEFTISDPTTWSRPWTAMVPWGRIKQQLYEYSIHEENYDLVHLLAGARLREARGEKVPASTGRRPAGGDDR